MKKIYIIEGIPGTGKTTFAKQLAAHFKKINQEAILYVEGDMHPADMAWNALLTREEYEAVLKENPIYAAAIIENSSEWKDSHIIAYTKIENLAPELYSYFESKEIYDGKISAETFCELNHNRWKSFGEKAQDINIFECALLQNSVNELLLFHCMAEEEITAYVNQLIKDVEVLSPEIIYLNIDTKKSLERASAERVNEQGERVWQQRVVNYIADSPWGKKNNLIGNDGMETYFAYRKQLELRILKSLKIKSHVLDIEIVNQDRFVQEWIEKNI